MWKLGWAQNKRGVTLLCFYRLQLVSLQVVIRSQTCEASPQTFKTWTENWRRKIWHITAPSSSSSLSSVFFLLLHLRLEVKNNNEGERELRLQSFCVFRFLERGTFWQSALPRARLSFHCEITGKWCSWQVKVWRFVGWAWIPPHLSKASGIH